MSFSSNTKKEICKLDNNDLFSQKYEMYGMLLFSKNFSNESIIFTTQQACIKDLIVNFITSLNRVIVDVINKPVHRKGRTNDFVVFIPEECDRVNIINEFNLCFNCDNNKIEVRDENFKNNIMYFLRGVFLSCGTITNPNSGYNLEFIVSKKSLVTFLEDVILSIENFSIKPNVTERKGYYVLYIKDSESIADFLAYIGACLASMELMQVKMYKEVRNYVNRTTNFQTANICKTATASAIQVECIKNIKNKVGLDYLTDDLKELAILRLDNPEMSLRELGELLSVPLSRSGVNHRLKKIIEISNKI